MEEKKQPEHKCNVCRFYDPFYIKKDTCFEKLKDGYCRNCKEIKNRFDGCEEWEIKPYWYFRRKLTTERVLKDILFHLMAIREIIRKEENEKNKSKR